MDKVNEKAIKSFMDSQDRNCCGHCKKYKQTFNTNIPYYLCYCTKDPAVPESNVPYPLVVEVYCCDDYEKVDDEDSISDYILSKMDDDSISDDILSREERIAMEKNFRDSVNKEVIKSFMYRQKRDCCDDYEKVETDKIS